MWRLVFAIARVLIFVVVLACAAYVNWTSARSARGNAELVLRVVTARPLPKEAELGRRDLRVEVAWIHRGDPVIGQVSGVVGWRTQHAFATAGAPVRWEDLIRPPPKKAE